MAIKMNKKSSLILILSIFIVGCLAYILWVKFRPIERGMITCKNDLKCIGTAIHMYADEHDGDFPPDLLSLMPTYLSDHRIFRCHYIQGKRQREIFGFLRDKDKIEVHYIYLSGPNLSSPDDFILAFCMESYDGRGRNVLFKDAHAQFLEEDEFHSNLLKIFNSEKYNKQYSKEAINLIEEYLKEKP